MKQLTSKLAGIKAFFICFVMRSFWVEMVESHKFFARKSQHYVLGNWKQYITNSKAIRKYELQYPKSWIKFMWYCYNDFVRGLNYA